MLIINIKVVAQITQNKTILATMPNPLKNPLANAINGF